MRLPRRIAPKPKWPPIRHQIRHPAGRHSGFSERDSSGSARSSRRRYRLSPELDLDTGNPSSVGEYALADQTYAKLLAQLVKPPKSQASAAVDPQLAAAIEKFFAHPVASSAPPPSRKVAEKAVLDEQQVQADLAVLKMLPPPAVAGTTPQP